MSSEVKDLPAKYYDFGRYVDRQRWLTYYRQLTLILLTEPKRVLEIGVGPGIVRAVLRDRGVHVETVDINDDLGADHVADVRALPPVVSDGDWDWVICSRVLHHIQKTEIRSALEALSALKAKRVLITVPREDLSLQFTFRRTAGKTRIAKISGGSRLKRALRKRSIIKSEPSGIWMLNGEDGIAPDEFRDELERVFSIHDEFVLQDDPSHVFYVLDSSKA